MRQAARFDMHYDEGAAVGYRWYERQKLEPLFAFGEGASCTSFAHDSLTARLDAGELWVRFQARNTGTRAGQDVPQIFVAPVAGGWEAPRRLDAFSKVELAPEPRKRSTCASIRVCSPRGRARAMRSISPPATTRSA